MPEYLYMTKTGSIRPSSRLSTIPTFDRQTQGHTAHKVAWIEIITPPPTGERSIVTSVSVCLSTCVFVCPRSYLRNYTTDLHQIFLYSLPMSLARSCSGGVVICYVLPVLWMTSYLLISQSCSTSPPSWGAVHTQPWVWLWTVHSNTSCRPPDARDCFSGAYSNFPLVATTGTESAWTHSNVN